MARDPAILKSYDNHISIQINGLLRLQIQSACVRPESETADGVGEGPNRSPPAEKFALRVRWNLCGKVAPSLFLMVRNCFLLGFRSPRARYRRGAR